MPSYENMLGLPSLEDDSVRCNSLGCGNFLQDGTEKRTGTCTECLRGLKEAGRRY